MPEYLLGEGILNWPAMERRSDRYGYVHLSPDVIPLDFSSDEEPSYIPLKRYQGKGKLIARILKTRQSQHIGDLCRGIFPTTPDVGEEICLGEGRLHYEDHNVGLKPLKPRHTDWLDPHMLYRCHEQTVQLVFMPTP
jgi:hypothetical protein